MSDKRKILIFGTGVIGSIYAVKLSNAGHSVYVYARGNRLQSLENKGLLYSENNTIKKAPVTILDKLSPTDIFDYIFVPIKYE
jgi:2-dehydropantoate 2-reductase